MTAKSTAREGDGVAVPVVQSTAPERIWLTVSDDEYDAGHPFPDDYGDELCWSADAPIAVCVPYVRADLAAMQAQQGAGPDWRELLDAVVAQFDDPGCTCTFQDESCCPHAIAAAALAAAGAPR